MYTYQGSITAQGTGATASFSVSLPTGRNIRFSGIKLESLYLFDPSAGPVAQGTLFLAVDEIIPQAVDILNGVEKSVIGGAQFAGGGYLIINNSLAPIKSMGSTDSFRGNTLNFHILDSQGQQLTGLPVTTNFSATISLWV